ncbi:nitric oxide reductase activation protein NorD [Rhizobium sp. TRM95796]|uniref:nitric oxide reductase activation protein NorD n=1 Tax=Rhizobium sp. TRM95796 TaxID=2979862 RepID=UPI0021E92953|nr:VWA domain-containing protein [Rhizobium sp. TRM95796]MCV3768687.1 VWA domain-containing protein [Rhizobium sp. TRM95796]
MFEFLELEESVGKAWHRLVGSTSSMPRYPQAAISFDDVKPVLATCFRAFGGDIAAQLGPAHARASGHRLRLRQLVGLGEEKTAPAARDRGAVQLPPVIDLFSEPALNRDLYIWLAAYMAQMEMTATDAKDALNADVAALDAAKRATRRTQQAFPGLASRFAALCRGVLAGRRRGALPPVEQLVENEALAMLKAGAGLPIDCPPSIFPRSAPAGYQPLMPIPLWPRYEPRAEVPKGVEAEYDAATTGDDLGSAGRYRADRETERGASDRSPFILNRFEKILAMAEMVNVDRPADDNDEADREAARDLDEITLGRRKERPSSKFRFDLVLPPEAVDPSAIEAEISYPEWNYRTDAYMLAYCRVVTTVPGEAEASLMSTEETRAHIRNVRRQFELLRPKNEALKAQLDGEELDLDALVRRQTDLVAGGEGSDRIHLLSRPQGQDLAVTILVDVSLSTDAWHDDHRVLDVEKEALAALAHGLSACGVNHSVLTFTSRRRAWVRIETVKAFGEPMSERVERRIAGLKPGYYTRMGAAIRHAAAELAKQPNRRRLLLVLTDGKPNDIDHYEGRFALEDSRKAVAEARRSGAAVFAVTVDKEAQSYLPVMFGRHGFTVVGDIGKLPRALPAIYRGLTR